MSPKLFTNCEDEEYFFWEEEKPISWWTKLKIFFRNLIHRLFKKNSRYML